MRKDVAREITAALGPWTDSVLLTDRRGTQVWRLRMPNSQWLAVKIALDGEAALLPAREAAVIRAAEAVVGSTVGEVTATGRLAEGGSWLATPWWCGTTMGTTSALYDPANEMAFVRSAVAAADGLASLHAAGWAHGDVQADHFVRTGSGIRVLDLATAYNPCLVLPVDLQIPYNGALVHLEPPEVASSLLLGEDVVPSPAADVYAFGGALWQCRTGTWPVDYTAAGVDPAPGSPEVKRKVIAGEWHRRQVAPLPGFGPLLERALAGAPELRPTAAQVAEELRLLLPPGSS